jgi:hypothetical protein
MDRSRRWTHRDDGTGVVVFLIGMRVNRWRRVRAWWPVFTAMPRMLRELYADPASGLLGHRMTLSADGPLVVQYWRDREHLTAYARDPGRGHRPAWQRFNASARASEGAVGIWHETFDVPAGASESIYVDMPLRGLAAATGAAQPERPEGKRPERERLAKERLAKERLSRP